MREAVTLQAKETRKPESGDPGGGCAGIPRSPAYHDQNQLDKAIAAAMRDELMDELRLLARKWRRFQQDRREQRELCRTLGWVDRVAVAYTEGYFAGLFASDLERLIQRFEGGGAARGAHGQDEATG